MNKLWAFVWKELYTTYTDRNMILIMIVTPVALASIIALAFSGFIQGAGNDVVVRDLPVAIVNHDQGVEINGSTQNNGQIFVDLLVPPADATEADLEANPLYQLTDSSEVEDETAAREGVERGDYVAAIIIPEDFSQRITYSDTNPTLQPVSVQVYGNSGYSIAPTIISGIAESIAANIAAGNITIAATIGTLVERAQTDPAFGLTFLAASASGEFQPDFSPAFDPSTNPIRIEAQTVTGEAVTLSPLVTLGSAVSVFFMLFTGTGSVGALLDEQRNGTLGRLLATPTPRWLILISKLIGALANCIIQVILLFVILTLVSSAIAGELQFIWGNNLLAFAAVILAVSLAASGMGALFIGVVKTPEQLNVISGVVSLAMGALGGAFFNVDLIPVASTLSRLSIVYWGSNAFSKLSIGDSDIGLNLVVLLGLGTIMFVVGLVMFNRRLNG